MRCVHILLRDYDYSVNLDSAVLGMNNEPAHLYVALILSEIWFDFYDILRVQSLNLYSVQDLRSIKIQ